MSNGYAGKILVVDLTSGEISSLNTADYAEYGGGHGIGSAVFFDLCKDKTISAYDPGNVITLMTGPIQGTLAPFGGGRCEVQAIGPQPWPIEWFTRSNFGGRFAGQLKFAGWDGVAVTGASEKPVWLDIRDDKVTIRDASETGDALWGLGTYEAEQKIYELVRGGSDVDWTMYGGTRDSGRSAQNPSVISCGQAGENLVRFASLIHEGGGGAGQGGFGAVFGSKNLKAVSVIGTGDLEIADPKALMEARAWWQANYFNFDDYKPSLPGMHSCTPGGGGNIAGGVARNVGQRPQGCLGCTKLCHGGRGATGEGPGSSCFDMWYQSQSGVKWGNPAAGAINTDILQGYGINAWEPSMALPWLVKLYKTGILGPGKQIESRLPFDAVGSDAFNKAFLDCIVNGTDIGADLKEGCARAATKWGRYEEDVTSGDLAIAAHGYAHHYDARTESEWGFGTALGDRDINEHDITWVLYWHTSLAPMYGQPQALPAKEMVEMIASTLLPYQDDPMMLDFSDEGIYSDGMVKFVSWHRAYTRFWKQSAMYCDWGITDWLNPWAEGYKGLTPELEPRFYQAVTGDDTTFEKGMEIGTKIWNLDRAIWYLQGRTSVNDQLAEWQFKIGAPAAHSTYEIPYIMPVYENGEWSYKNVWGRFLDHAKFDDFLARYYEFEGWDSNGCPTSETLKKLGLGKAADELSSAGKG